MIDNSFEVDAYPSCRLAIPDKQKTVQHKGEQPLFENWYIDNWIVFSIETYLIPIYHMNKCSQSNWIRHIEACCIPGAMLTTELWPAPTKIRWPTIYYWIINSCPHTNQMVHHLLLTYDLTSTNLMDYWNMNCLSHTNQMVQNVLLNYNLPPPIQIRWSTIYYWNMMWEF